VNYATHIVKMQSLGMSWGDMLLWESCIVKRPTKRQLDRIISRINKVPRQSLG